jgi:hypothetical protein
MTAALYKRLNTDDRLLITGARTIDVATGVSSYLDATAVVMATVLDHATQVAVPGDTFPLALTYITGSLGDFHGPLRDTLTLTVGQRIDVRVTIDHGPDQHRTLVLPVIVVEDTGDL